MVDIFADFGISGMNDTNRIEFQRMLEMCNKGKIDLIITKSISRFARNGNVNKSAVEIYPKFRAGGADIFLDSFKLLIQDYVCTLSDSYTPTIV